MKHGLFVALLVASCAGKPDVGTETGALAGDDGTGTDGTDGTDRTDDNGRQTVTTVSINQDFQLGYAEA